MEMITKVWEQFKRTDKWQMRLLQWPFALVIYVILAPLAFVMCLAVGLAWPILGKD